MHDLLVTEIQNKYPFFTLFQYGPRSIIGVIQDVTPQIYVIYDISNIRDDKALSYFLYLARQWWANPSVPICGLEGFAPYRAALRGYIRREIKLLSGPIEPLSKSFSRRMKRRDEAK